MTETQRNQVRLQSGDMHLPYLVQDATLDRVISAASSDLKLATYETVLLMRAALMSKVTDPDCEFTEADERRLRVVEGNIEFWRSEAGAYGRISTGGLDLNLDADEDNRDARTDDGWA